MFWNRKDHSFSPHVTDAEAVRGLLELYARECDRIGETKAFDVLVVQTAHGLRTDNYEAMGFLRGHLGSPSNDPAVCSVRKALGMEVGR